MKLFTQQFEHEGVVGLVQRWNPRRGAVSKAQYVKALEALYPELQVDLNAAMGNIMTITRLASVSEFGDLAAQIVELHGAGFDWPAPTASPAEIDLAYQSFLDDQALWDVIAELVKSLNTPNGAAGKPEEQLTDAEKNDPLSVSSAES